MIFSKQTIMLCNKPTAIAMSSMCVVLIVASTYHRSYYCTRPWLHWHTPNQTHTHNFILFVSSRL